jgi:multidrug efflux pump subunit AcrA (membrane-fusion protein)
MNKFKSALLIAAILITAVFIGSILSSQNKEDLRGTNSSQKSKSKSIIIKNEKLIKTITTTGRMFAFEKLELFAEVSGLLEETSTKFKVGNNFKKGDVLISINDDVYINSLLAHKSSLLNQLTLLLPDLKFDFPLQYKKWESYLNNFAFEKPLLKLPETDTEKERFYIASNNIYKLFYDTKSMEAVHAKYTIKAPFNGTVTSSYINPGTLVRNGQKLGEFINTSLFEMEAPINLADLEFIRSDLQVQLESYNSDDVFTGTIVRINKAIDQKTQSVKIFIQSNDKRIKDGMFFTAKITINRNLTVAKIPRNAIFDNNKVQIKEANNLKVIDIEIVDSHESYYFVKGLADNSILVINQFAVHNNERNIK